MVRPLDGVVGAEISLTSSLLTRHSVGGSMANVLALRHKVMANGMRPLNMTLDTPCHEGPLGRLSV